MSAQEIAMVIIGGVGGVAAFMLVTSKNVVHAALFLVVTLAMVGCVYLLMSAEFVGWTQILIYVGAIVVLILFSLMLTRAPIGREALDNQQRGLAALVGLGVLAGLVFLIQDAFGSTPAIKLQVTQVASVGSSIFRSFVVPFEVVSVLLLAALVGAVVIARKEDQE